MGAIGELDLALEACDQAGDKQAACATRGELALTWIELGDYARAELLLKQTLKDAKERSLVAVDMYTLPDLGWALTGMGRFEEARETFEQSLRLSKSNSNTWGLALSSLYHSMLSFEMGDFAASEQHARTAIENVLSVPSPRAAALAALARALLAQGRNEEAFASAHEATLLLDGLGSSKYSEALVRLMNAETKMAVGDEAGARAGIRTARDRVLERASRITDVSMRHSFLTRVADNVRTLELAQQWGVCETP